MSMSELLALSLVLSVAASALVWLAGSLVERTSPDPRLRDRVWGAGLLLSALPPLAVAVLLLAPAPVREVAAPAIIMAPVMVAPTVQAMAVPTSAVLPDLAFVASLFLVAAVGMGVIRFISLAVRIGRLRRLMHRAVPADADLAGRVETMGRSLHIQPPKTVVSAMVTEALLSGLGRPRLILPQASDEAASDAVIAHELAHLKRGDHRTLWLEEALLVLLAINPLLPVLRARRDAAREEACDAIALAAAGPDARRAYARTLIEALKTRAGPRGAGDVVALTFTGAGRTSAMNRLKAVMTPAAPAGRRARLIAAALGLAVTVIAGGATVALAGQRAVEVRMIPAPQPDGPADEAAAASQAAVQAALAALPPETRDRFRNTSAADYRAYCASADAAEEGFCKGVIFSHLVRAPGNGLCVPEAVGDEQARLTGIVARGKSEIARLAPRRDEGAYEYSERALKAAYPCGAEAATSAASNLTVRIGRSDEPFILGSSNLLRVTLESQDGERGARNTIRSEMRIAPDQPLEREVRFSLKDEQLPTPTRGRTYDLTAEITDADGRVFYAAEPVTVRMAPGSRGRLVEMRPELVLARTATVSPPAVARRAYQARLTITDNGRVVAAGRMRLVPDDGDASTILTAGGSDYRFELRLAQAEPASDGQEHLLVHADLGGAAEAGGLKPGTNPRLLMRPDGTARMQWGSEAGLLFEIVVEPA